MPRSDIAVNDEKKYLEEMELMPKQPDQQDIAPQPSHGNSISQNSVEAAEATVEQVQTQSNLTPAEQARAIVEQVEAIEGLTPDDEATDTMIEAVTQMEKPDGGITESDYAQQQLDKMIEVVDDLHLPPATRAEMLIQGIQELKGLSPAVEEETIIAVIEHLETAPKFAELPVFARTQALIVTLDTLNLSVEAKARAKLLLTMNALEER